MIDLVDVKAGVVFPLSTLKKILDTNRRLATFAAHFQLDQYELGSLLRLVRPGVTMVQFLSDSAAFHSMELQTYIVGLGFEHDIRAGEIDAPDEVGDDELLVELFEQFRVKVATQIDDFAVEMDAALKSAKPKKAKKVLRRMRKLHKTVTKIGLEELVIERYGQEPVLVILDVSASMGEPLIEAIVEPVVAMAVEADAYLAIVSNTTTWWRPGEFSVASVLAAAEFQGTKYETLKVLLDKDWSTVVTVADYDSSMGAKHAIADCTGKIGQVLDISVVECPTFLSECVGQLAGEVRPLMVAAPAISHAYGG